MNEEIVPDQAHENTNGGRSWLQSLDFHTHFN